MLSFAGQTGERVRSVIIHPRQPWIATIDVQHTVTWWDTEGGEVLWTLKLSALDQERKAAYQMQRRIEKSPDYHGPDLTLGSGPKSDKLGSVVGVAFADPDVASVSTFRGRMEGHGGGGGGSGGGGGGGGGEEKREEEGGGRPKAHWIVAVTEHRVCLLEYVSSHITLVEKGQLEKAVSSFALIFPEYRIALGGVDGTIRVWDTEESRMVVRLAGGHVKAVTHICVSSPGLGSHSSSQPQVLVSASASSGEVCLWDLASETLLACVAKPHSGSVLGLALCGSRVYSVGSDKKLVSYGDGMSPHVHSIPGKSAPIRAIASSPVFDAATSLLAVREKDSSVYGVSILGERVDLVPLIDLRAAFGMHLDGGLGKRDKVRVFDVYPHPVIPHLLYATTSVGILGVRLDPCVYDVPGIAVAGVSPFRSLATATQQAYVLQGDAVHTLNLSEVALRANAITARHFVVGTQVPVHGPTRVALSGSETYLAVEFSHAALVLIYKVASWDIVARYEDVSSLVWASGPDDVFAMIHAGSDGAMGSVLDTVAGLEKKSAAKKAGGSWGPQEKPSSLLREDMWSGLCAQVGVYRIDSSTASSSTTTSSSKSAGVSELGRVALPPVSEMESAASTATPDPESGLHPLTENPCVLRLFGGPVLGVTYSRLVRSETGWSISESGVWVPWDDPAAGGSGTRFSAPQRVLWDESRVEEGVVAVGYASKVVVMSGGEAVGTFPFEMVSGVWFQHSLVIATPTDVRILFPSPSGLSGSHVLASWGSVAIAGVVDTAVVVVGTSVEGLLVDVLPFDDTPGLLFRLLVQGGDLRRGMGWAEFIHPREHDVLAQFLEARGHVDSALSLPGLSSWGRFGMALRARRLGMALEVLVDVFGAEGGEVESTVSRDWSAPVVAPMPVMGATSRGWAELEDPVGWFILLGMTADEADDLKVMVQAYSAAGARRPRVYIDVALVLIRRGMDDLVAALCSQLEGKGLGEEAVLVSALAGGDPEAVRRVMVKCGMYGDASLISVSHSLPDAELVLNALHAQASDS